MEPCPKCGRQPKLVHLETRGRGSAWDGSYLMMYVLRCRPFWGLLGTHLTTQPKGVASGDAWYRWKEDLTEEWDKLASQEPAS